MVELLAFFCFDSLPGCLTLWALAEAGSQFPGRQHPRPAVLCLQTLRYSVPKFSLSGQKTGGRQWQNLLPDYSKQNMVLPLSVSSSSILIDRRDKFLGTIYSSCSMGILLSFQTNVVQCVLNIFPMAWTYSIHYKTSFLRHFVGSQTLTWAGRTGTFCMTFWRTYASSHGHSAFSFYPDHERRRSKLLLNGL